MLKSDLYLASASPRRRELLRQIGVNFSLLTVEVDETPAANEVPSDYVERLARSKACAGWLKSRSQERLPVLGADTTVVLNGQIMGKPSGRSEAIAMLQRLSGNEHSVYSAVALAYQDRVESRVVSSRVSFCVLSLEECEEYWSTGEPVDKAGSYAIQGYAAVFVSKIEGSYSSVVGLPLMETATLLKDFEVPIWDRNIV